MTHRRREVTIELLIAHEESQRTFITIQFGRHLLHIIKGAVDAGHRLCDIEITQVTCQCFSIGQDTIGLRHHCRHLMVKTGCQLM